MRSVFHIAIDGPVAAGKGTVSRLVAKRLGFLYVDTGAMYRMTALLAINKKISFENKEKIIEALKESKMEMRNPNDQEKDGRLITVFLDGEDVSWKIRTEEVSAGSSKVAVIPEVREILVQKQQKIAKNKDVVMEGRDITYRVLPEADLKIFLTASTRSRAQRRLLQLQLKGIDITLEEIEKDVIERDQRDMGRDTDPLKKTVDAWEIDTTDLAIEEVVELIVKRVEKMRK